MEKGNYLSSLLRSNKTVLTLQDIAMLWHEINTPATRVRLNYYINKGELVRIRKGLYAKNKQYNRLELATRILTPSYISFETILVKEGMIFQYYESIFIASYATRELTIGGQSYSFRKMKDSILLNSTGIEHSNETSTATKERAFLDMLYVNSDYHFDNLQSLNWDLIFEFIQIYENQRMEKLVARYHRQSHDH